MKNATKNQDAWSVLNNHLGFIDKINKFGFYEIKAEQIKSLTAREPRLMAKFDHSVKRPTIFQDNNISILPITSNSYKLLRFNSFFPVDYCTKIQTLSSKEIFLKYESINIHEIQSEDRAIIVSDISNALSEFTQETELKLTNKGKFGLNMFSFNLNTDQGVQNIIVNGAQAELDAGFEGNNFYLIEAKIGKMDDFNIRQLYFPYRYWSQRLKKKKVVPILLNYNNNVFYFWKYRFTNPQLFNSISLERTSAYSFESPEQINIKAIIGSIKESDYVPSDSISVPFPQADDFEKVITAIELVNSGIATKDEFACRFAFDKRQADYYFNAAKYLNLLDIEKNIVFLSPLGKIVADAGRNERHRLLILTILKRKVFYNTLQLLMKKGSLDTHSVVKLMKKNHVLIGSTEKMFFRRAQTVIAWCKWIRSLIT